LAISKQKKQDVLKQYQDWFNRSQAVIMMEYVGLSMKDIDALRAKVREAGGEFHVVKNTIGKIAFNNAGAQIPENLFEGSTAVGFAFTDAPAMAKAIADFAKTSEFIKIKGGLLGKQSLSAADVKALADLPPLPVMRAKMLGTFLAPASQLVRTLAEPARQIAAVIKSYSEKDVAIASN
jgi:large subunit ribosomal protein L10